MKILYVSYDGMTDQLGQSQVIPYINELIKEGHEIYLISCEKKKPKSHEYINILELLRQSRIKWFPLKYTSKPPIISTLIDLHNINLTASKIIKEHGIDVIHCRSYISALCGLKMKKKYGIQFIFDMRGFWADERIDGKIWDIKNPIFKLVYSYFKKKEKLFFENSDYIISLTDNAKEEILKWNLSGQPLPIEVIPCCADMELFTKSNVDEIKKENIRKKLNITENDFVLSYLGSIGTWYMLDEMLDFFNLLLKKKKNAKFLFITSDSPEFILESAINKGIPVDRLVIQKASRNEVPIFLSLSQISIFFIKPVFSKKASSPTKMGEIMGMGIPIICNSGVGDVDKILSDSNAGLLVNSFSDEEYSLVIEKMDALLIQDKGKIRKLAEKYYSLKDGAERYSNVYKKLTRDKEQGKSGNQ
ncbi:MAG: glycosyltransferase family 4 protein [Bacteroidetes bacterium]|nr:glycosyltransferase family 4 protein [Bacteroidota bacterium]